MENEQANHAVCDVAPAKDPQPTGPRGDRVKRACSECKRRKVKCDGRDPCYYCQWYKHPERCVYPQLVPRHVLTRESVDIIRRRLDAATSVLGRLFPRSTLDDLIPLSREALEALLNEGHAGTHRPSAAATSNSGGNSLSPQSARVSGYSQSTGGAFEYYESAENLEGAEAVADDVNALSLRQGRTSSYVGPSSATSGLRALLKIASDFRLARPGQGNQQDTSVYHAASPVQVAEPVAEPAAEPAAVARVVCSPQRLVDAYFYHIHPSTPILDERYFRSTFESNEREDSAWLALLHMVFALGTIACTKSESNEDIYHYKIAKSHLGLDSFGSGHIETLQALILMAGWYLQYRNRPNMASAIMGAIFRMANALSLHRELSGEETPYNRRERELRRRIWWSIVVLDAGEATTLGRVANTTLFDLKVKLPRNIDDLSGEITTGPGLCSVLLAEIDFSKQASKIQDRLISDSNLNFAETVTLDAHLTYWFDTLPAFLRAGDESTAGLLQPRLSLKWKYQNLRIILYRSTLTEATLRRVKFEDLSSEQKVCVRKCQSLAGEAINNIASEWGENQYSGWPAVWFLFQACTIPLLSLYGMDSDAQQIQTWNRQVQQAIQLFKNMTSWSIAAKQTHEVISFLYETYRENQGAHEYLLRIPSTAVRTGSLNPTQARLPPSYNQIPVEWPAWDDIINVPGLESPISAFPNLNLPELGSCLNMWDAPEALAHV